MEISIELQARIEKSLRAQARAERLLRVVDHLLHKIRTIQHKLVEQSQLQRKFQSQIDLQLEKLLVLSGIMNLLERKRNNLATNSKITSTYQRSSNPHNRKKLLRVQGEQLPTYKFSERFPTKTFQTLKSVVKLQKTNPKS